MPQRLKLSNFDLNIFKVNISSLQMLVDFTGQLSSLSHQTASSISLLSLASVMAEDSGNYTCQPAGLNKVNTSEMNTFTDTIWLDL